MSNIETGNVGIVNEKTGVVEEVLKIFKNDWSKQVILYGPPGTSKTYSSVEIAARFLASKNSQPEPENHEACKEFLKEKAKEQYKVVQFHPSYSYEDFVRGITVRVKENETLPSYEVTSKVFEEFCKQDGTKVLVIDEINRAALSSVLGELIYGLEYRGEAIDTPYELKKEGKSIPLKIPEDLYIIGTMNTADRSIGSMDYAVRRRFAFVQVPSEPSAIKGSWKKIGNDVEAFYNFLMSNIFADELKGDPDLDIDDIKIGHTYFLGDPKICKEEEEEYFKYRVKYQIWPICQEYIKDGLIRKEGEGIFKNNVKEKWPNMEL